MVGLLGGDYWGICSQREMDTWVGYQVGLKLSQVDVEGAIKSQRGSDRADNLSNKSVQIGICWSLNIKITSTDIVDGFIVYHKGTVRVFQGGVSGQDRVVGFNYSGRDLRSWVDSEL